MATFADLLEVLGDRDIYSWRTKKVEKTVGLLNLIGSPEARERARQSQSNKAGKSKKKKAMKKGQPEVPEMDPELFDSIWQTQCQIYGAEIFLDVGKVYLNFCSVLDKMPQITLGFGVWIKIPNNKEKYLEAYRAKLRGGKRKRGSDGDYGDGDGDDFQNEETQLLIQHDLLKSRSLAELLTLSRADGYIQLGDLDLSWTHGHEPYDSSESDSDSSGSNNSVNAGSVSGGSNVGSVSSSGNAGSVNVISGSSGNGSGSSSGSSGNGSSNRTRKKARFGPIKHVHNRSCFKVSRT